MPKVKKEKIEQIAQPYNLNNVKSYLKNWKNDAQSYELQTKTHFDQIIGYISQHMGKMHQDEVVDLYDAVSKGLDVIERKGTTRISRLDNYITG